MVRDREVFAEVNAVDGSDVYVMTTVYGVSTDGMFLFLWDREHGVFRWPHSLEPVSFNTTRPSYVPEEVFTFASRPGAHLLRVGRYLIPFQTWVDLTEHHAPVHCRDDIDRRLIAFDLSTRQWICPLVQNIEAVPSDQPFQTTAGVTPDAHGGLWMSWFRGECRGLLTCELVYGRLDTTVMPPRLEMFEEMTVDVRRAFPIYDLWGYLPDSILFVVDDMLHAIGNLSYDPRDIPISRYNRQARRWEPAMRHRDDLLIDEPLRVSPVADGTVVFPGSTYDSILLQQPSCASVAKWDPRTDTWSCPWPVGRYHAPPADDFGPSAYSSAHRFEVPIVRLPSDLSTPGFPFYDPPSRSYLPLRADTGAVFTYPPIRDLWTVKYQPIPRKTSLAPEVNTAFRIGFVTIRLPNHPPRDPDCSPRPGCPRAAIELPTPPGWEGPVTDAVWYADTGQWVPMKRHPSKTSGVYPLLEAPSLIEVGAAWRENGGWRTQWELWDRTRLEWVPIVVTGLGGMNEGQVSLFAYPYLVVTTGAYDAVLLRRNGSQALPAYTVALWDWERDRVWTISYRDLGLPESLPQEIIARDARQDGLVALTTVRTDPPMLFLWHTATGHVDRVTLSGQVTDVAIGKRYVAIGTRTTFSDVPGCTIGWVWDREERQVAEVRIPWSCTTTNVTVDAGLRYDEVFFHRGKVVWIVDPESSTAQPTPPPMGTVTPSPTPPPTGTVTPSPTPPPTGTITPSPTPSPTGTITPSPTPSPTSGLPSGGNRTVYVPLVHRP